MNIVQVGGADLNMAVTSREEILAVCRDCGRRRAFVRKHEACGFGATLH